MVRWQSARTDGYGQVAGYNPDGTVNIRTWLPARTRQVTVPAGNLTVRCTLTQLLEALR